jgi:actin-related protein 10
VYIYFRHLLVSPKDRRLVVVESLLCPTLFRETLAKVFFRHFEVGYATETHKIMYTKT